VAKILLVDDDKSVIEAARIPLEANGHEVIVSEDPDAVRALMKEHTPDLVILDVMFPENPVAGFEICRAIQNDQEIRNIPVVLLSAINETYNMGFANCGGSNALPTQEFLEKPLSPKRLLEVVDSCVK